MHAPKRRGRSESQHRVGRLLRNNGLSLALFALFALSMTGQIVSGLSSYNDERRDHGRPTVTLARYLRTGHFLEATFENWESEFLQMGLFVVLTIHLRQRGSSESKKIDGRSESDQDPRQHRHDAQAPWPVRRGGIALALYEHSLSIALLALFVVSFALHAVGGLAHSNEIALEHGHPIKTLLGFVSSSEFWFQSFQNWQSEFLSVFALVILSIFLRQRGSPQSKPVAASHWETEG